MSMTMTLNVDSIGHDVQLLRLTKLSAVSVMLLLLAACTTLPKAIQADVDANLTLLAVNQNFADAEGKVIRWGGRLAKLENVSDGTWLEIVEQPLYGDGRPRLTDETRGRFRAYFSKFLDPAIYSEGRDVTVVGVLERVETRLLGQQEYAYPIVLSKGHYLWPSYIDYGFNEPHYAYSHCDYPYCSPYLYPLYPRASLYIGYPLHRRHRHCSDHLGHSMGLHNRHLGHRH